MKKIFCIILLQLVAVQLFSQSIQYEIANCNGERRTLLFMNQITSVLYACKGELSLKKNLSLKFSPDSHLNLDSLDLEAIRFGKAFPKNYWSQGVPVITLDTRPNEEGRIWFENVYVEEDSKGNIKPIAALKVVFEGNDAGKERVSPKILDIIYISDPKALKKYIAVIKQLKIVHNIKTTNVLKEAENAPPPPIRNM
ncbi:hypothetical protein [Chitinophaga filiformis]|uniref:GLPGLI family protein n=1 Tax=Chitinophaga filiformis TaxID=104663 RepID=A0ABY4I4L5_CHIFI|nr:hypothetical protein [Chitinophaga filiformis]UPK71013.1 hypothetical protein MYF79_06840 [Chitinophaga filiformis]